MKKVKDKELKQKKRRGKIVSELIKKIDIPVELAMRYGSMS